MELDLFGNNDNVVDDFYKVSDNHISLTKEFKEALSNNRDYKNWKQGTPLPLLPKVGDNVSIASMFADLHILKSLNLSGWDTSNINDMGELFTGCHLLELLDLKGWDTSKVEYMDKMFSGCQSLQSLDIGGWDTSNVISMAYMFNKCITNLNRDYVRRSRRKGLCESRLVLNISSWDTSKVEDMSGMFNHCKMLTHLDISGWNVSNVTSMDEMFRSCVRLINIDINDWDTSNVKTKIQMFDNCKSLDLLNMKKVKTGMVTDPTSAKEIEEKLGIEELESWYSSLGFDMGKLKRNPLEYIQWCDRIGL